MAAKKILLLATLDTKGEETARLRERIEELGREVMVLDLSMRRGPRCREADIAAREVAAAGGCTIDEIHACPDRARNTEVMIRGAVEVAKRLVGEGRVTAVVGLGGSTGSLMATDVMRALPFGLPKLMVSSTAALPGLATRYIGTGDICLFHSVVEIAGNNRILQSVIDRAARAACAMAGSPLPAPGRAAGGEKMVALTMMGPCEQCASAVRRALEGEGLQVAGFSAAGIGDRAMDEMIGQGLFDGVVDLAPTGVIEHLVGGMRDAGPLRLSAASEAGVPQVVSTAGVNHITPARRAYTEDHRARRKYELDRHRTWLRASEKELRAAARAFAARLNRARGPVRVVIPTRGWSQADRPGNATYDPAEDGVFVDELAGLLRSDIELRTVDAHLEEPAFAHALVAACREVFGIASPRPARAGPEALAVPVVV